MLPKVLSHNRQCIREGRQRLGIPGSLPHQQFTMPGMSVSQQRDQRKQSQQDRRSTGNRQIRPLALRFHTQVGAHFVESHFHPPAHHKPPHHLRRLDRQIRAQQGLSLETAFGISDQNPPDGQGWQAVMKPDCRIGDDLNHFRTFSVPVWDHQFLPGGLRGVQNLLQGWQSRTLLARSAPLACFWSQHRAVERRIQAKTGDQTNRFGRLGHSPQEIDRGKAGIGQHHQPPTGQPTLHLEKHLASPVGQLLVPTHSFLIVAFRRTQSGQKRQCPHPFCPSVKRGMKRTAFLMTYIGSDTRNGSQEHQAQPPQSAGFHEMTLTGVHRILINAFGFDLGTPSALDCVIQSHEDGTGRYENLDQPGQQQFARFQVRPLC